MNDAVVDLWIGGLMILLSISLLICFIRLYLGPDVPNRGSFRSDQQPVRWAFLPCMRCSATPPFSWMSTIVTAVLGFLGAVMLARFLEQSKPDR